MKKIARLPVFLLLALTFLVTSCQKEEEMFIDETNEETITANSVLANLLLRTSQNDGDLDDIIDGSSCFSVKFPITVIANGQQVTLQNEDDLDIIEAIFDQFPNDIDTLEIVFPITVILDDYTEVVLNSQDELDALIAACENEGFPDSISCLDFEYPITFFTFDNNQQQTGTVTVNNDMELYQFLSNIGDDDYFSIDYPINVILQDGTVVQVNSNSELEAQIEACENSSGGGPIDPTVFEQNLTNGVWYITYFFDDFDETSNYNGYEFTFETDNTAQATNGTNTVPGTWMFEGGNTPDLTLFFGTTDPFDELDEDWDIIEATNEIIRLRDESGDGSIDYLTFERNPATGGGGTGTNDLINELTTGQWYVNLLDDDGEIETCDYVDYVFTYNLNGTATAVSATTTVNGFWSVQLDDGMLDLVLNFDITADPNFEDINDDWDVTSFSSELISLLDESGGNGGTDVLEFGRMPATGCGGGGGGSAQALNDALVDGLWFVAQYLDDGFDETGLYNGYQLDFSAGGSVTASNGSNNFIGTWSVMDTGGDLDLLLDFGTQIPFDEFNDDWDVLNFTSTLVELEDVSGGGGGTDNLTLQKL